MHVLLVEDDRMLASYIRRALEEQGYAVDSAFTGDEALAWAVHNPFDLILLDIMLPEVDGINVCAAIRQRAIKTPILMLTARDTVDDRVLGLDAGADDYLVKPFAIKELLARLRALIRRASDGSTQNVLQVADLVLDSRTRQVWRANSEIELTMKEIAILECLMRAPGQILSRTAIANQVWNYDVYHESNVVDVYIRNLRRKIDDPYPIKLIHTVRGAGYRLAVGASDS